MESLIVSASMGAINPVLGKLSRLISEEHAKLKDRERKEVENLKEELGCMLGLFRGPAMEQDPDVQVKEWMRQVREVAYDTEDWLDLFMYDQLRRELSFLERLSYKGRSRSRRLVEQIRHLNDRLVKASERRTRYQVADRGMPPASEAAVDVFGASSVAIDPWLLQREETAIDPPEGELLKHLLGDEQQLRVVSIVGMAGIGKSTLVKQVYRSMMKRRRFHYQAFVYVGQSPSVRAVLMDTLRQVIPQEQDGGDSTSSMSGSGETQAIAKLREFLKDKRYLIVFDDVWSISAWKAISCGLPANGNGSRIVATTRSYAVAKSCSNYPNDDVIHVMDPLDESDSKRLFHSRLFGSEEEKCREDLCIKVHMRVLKICGGLPWAILVLASLLAKKCVELGGWNTVELSKALSTLDKLEKYPPLQRMRKVLHMSYADLPLPMKSCLLYFSVFPKNCTINKDRLIWRWVAEGFIPSKGEENTLETGRSYFNELINRSLIQPVLGEDGDGEPTGCTLHAAVHDFVVSLSSEENFVTLDESMQRDVIRRLSLNYAKQEDGPLASDFDNVKINLSQARSLTVFGSAQRMPHLAKFLLLRVLDLEDAEKLESKNIEDIGRLFNLRYLGLGGVQLTELPESIGELQFLETLEVRRTNVRRLPPAASRLRRLARLLTKLLDDIPDGIEKMQDLQELSVLNVKSPRMLDLMNELVKLRQLRALGLKWCFGDELHGEIETYRRKFVSSLNKITSSSLESLFLHSGDACSLDFLADAWVPPRMLQKLVVKSLNYYFPATPIHLASCTNLSYLEIAINLSREEDLSIIAGLPELTTLKLIAKGRPVLIGHGFPCLKVFWFDCRGSGLMLVFEEAAMPQLRKLHVSFKLLAQQEAQQGIDFGLHNLYALKQVHANIDCYGASASEVHSMEYAMKRGVFRHPNKPALDLSKDNYIEENPTIYE